MPIDRDQLELMDNDQLTEHLQGLDEGLMSKQVELGAAFDQTSFIGAQMLVLVQQIYPEQRDRLLFDITVKTMMVDQLVEMESEIRRAKLMQGVQDQNGHVPNRATRRQAEREQWRQS